MNVRRLGALALACLTLAGCARTGAGVAARVGDTRITTSALTTRVTRGYENKAFAQSHPKDEYQRQWLNRLISAHLIEVAAQRLGVTVTEAQVDAQLKRFADNAGGQQQLEAQAAAQGVAKEDLRDATHDLVLRDAVADKLVADVVVTEKQLTEAYAKALPQLDVAHIAHILVKDAATAATVATEARKPGADFAALAKKYSQDANTNTEGGDLGQIGNGDGKFQASFEKAIFTGQTGSIVGPIKAESGYEVVKVIERRTTTFAQARDELRRTVIGQAREQKLAAYMTDLTKRLKVKVNPRFGGWDPNGNGVVAVSGDDLSSPAPSPGQNQPQPAPPAATGGP
ncbi:MAG: foldase protein PrsA [Frankiaceae bacterium]|nr:foldase protein PrsA [Frankiaceae bacterium]